jgi:exonuclease I
MNTEYVTEQTFGTPEQKSKTLQSLFALICKDNEFSLLRETLSLYCEEIAKAE